MSIAGFRRLRMPGLAVACTAVFAVGVALAGWALTVLLSPPGRAAEPAGFSTATVVEGEVGAELALNAAAEWSSLPTATNEAAGIVTSVDLPPGAEAQQGARLYAVNGRAVVVARGEVPAYRPLNQGDVGDDVRQLQQMLADSGFDVGPVDGVFGADARYAVERWQQSLGETATGDVGFGELVFVPSLPARLTLADTVRRGGRLVGGEQAVLGLGTSPVFTLPVGESQAAQIPTGTRVEIFSPSGHEWRAAVAGRSATPGGSTIILGLEAGQGEVFGTICGESCSDVPLVGQTLLAARVVTVESVRGAVVPSVALVSDAQQNLALIDSVGARHPVTVLAAARGMSVVQGVDPGLVVRVPDDPVDVGQATGSIGP